MVPVWKTAQLGEIVFPALIHERIFETQPTPVASGPITGFTPSGSEPRTEFRYSMTRDRAQ